MIRIEEIFGQATGQPLAVPADPIIFGIGFSDDTVAGRLRSLELTGVIALLPGLTACGNDPGASLGSKALAAGRTGPEA